MARLIALKQTAPERFLARFDTGEELRTTLAEVAPQIEVVATASSVAEAAAVIAGVGHDLIFMDIHLGDGSGFDIFQRTEISVPVIFITAYDSYALKAFENKGIDYLLKPFGREDLQRAIDKLDVRPDLALIDGNRAKDFGLPVRTIVKGDSLSASIAAASILAKVTRDRLMEQYDEQYPQYGFAVHKGYGTKRHYAALREYGPCPIHRQTFLKKFYAGT